MFALFTLPLASTVLYSPFPGNVTCEMKTRNFVGLEKGKEKNRHGGKLLHYELKNICLFSFFSEKEVFKARQK